MSRPAPSPLEALRAWPGLPPVFAKREDLLPHGGGAKVRRFLAHFEGARAEGPRAVAALSERGSHTFVTLARLQREGLLSRPLVFLETRGPRTPYADGNRRTYVGQEGVRLLTGPLPWLLLRLAALRLTPRAVEVLGLGGQTPGGVGAAAEAGAEARAQLAALGPFAGRTWHLLAAASGMLARGLLLEMTQADAHDESLLLVSTGPAAARRRLRRLLADDPRVRWLDAPAPGAPEAEADGRELERRTGLRLDPRHALCAWRAAARGLPGVAPVDNRILLWVTGPRLEPPAVSEA